MQHTIVPGFLIVMIAAMPSLAHAINCNAVKTKTEETICKSRELVWLDNNLNQVYSAAVAKSAAPGNLKADQRRWISGVRDICGTSACLTSAYQAQIQHLSNSMASWCESNRENVAGIWSRVGEDGFFEEFSADPDSAFESWLHHRPETSGTWTLKGCDLVISSNIGMSVEWKLIDLTKSELRVIEIGAAGLARYRRSKNQ